MDEIELGGRRFSHQDLAGEGVLIGGGGGFTRVFSDFLLTPDGVVSYLTYLAGDDGVIPPEVEPVRLLRKAETAQYDELRRRLLASGFYNHTSGPVASDELRYLVAAEGGRIHGVLWANRREETLPEDVRLVVRWLREVIVSRFGDEHGA